MSSIADPSVDEAAIGAINDAAGYCRTLWATFIGYAATIFVLTSGTTHEALLRQTPVKLPLFNVDSGIPLLLFYVIAPLLLVLFHLNLLMKLHDLRVRVGELILPLNYCDDDNAQFERNRLRRRLMAFDYATLKAGLVADRRERWLLSLVTDTTIFIMPVLLLLFVQLQFLPYHDWKISWLQRAFVIADLALIAYIQLWLGTKRVQPESETDAAPAGSSRKWRALFSFASFSFKPRARARGLLFAVPVLVSTIVLAFPGEPQDVFWKTAWGLKAVISFELEPNPYSALAGADIAEKFGIRRSLYLADRNLWAQEPSEDLLQALTEDTTIIALREDVEGASSQLLRTVQRIRNAALTLRGRNLSYANFENARLIAADFRPDLNNEQMRRVVGVSPNSTDLSGASFAGADLRGAMLPDVRAAGANLVNANLQSSVVIFGQLQGANLNHANLQGANLYHADLQGADLTDAQLQGASLSGAQLQGDTIYYAHLGDASLDGAHLEGAKLHEAQLQGANLSAAYLQGADLGSAQLQGANLGLAQLQGANLIGAHLEGANLRDAQLQGARLTETELQGADLSRAAITLDQLLDAKWEGAQLNSAIMEQLKSAAASKANRATIPTKVPP